MEYEQRVKNLYGTDPVTGDYNIELRLIAEEMSAIKQESDNIMLAVGDGSNFSAGIQILKNAPWRDPNGNLITNPNGTPASGSKIVLDAQRVEVNGELSAGIITANTATIQSIASQVVTTQVIDAVDGRIRNLTVTRLNTAGEGAGAPNDKITAYGNTLRMYDGDGIEKLKITADDAYLLDTPQQISLEGATNSRVHDSAGSSNLQSVMLNLGEIVISDADATEDYPAIVHVSHFTANLSFQIQGSNTATYKGVSVGFRSENLEDPLVQISCEGTSTSGGATVNVHDDTAALRPGTYHFVIIFDYGWSIPTAGRIEAIVSVLGQTISLFKNTINYVTIGQNGLIVRLGDGFYASFRREDETTRTIELMGTKKNGDAVGIRITENGLEANNGDGWHPILLGS